MQLPFPVRWLTSCGQHLRPLIVEEQNTASIECVAPREFVISSREVGRTLQGPLQKLLAKRTRQSLQSVDWEAVAQAHIHAVAGACLGMAIRYAGTGNVGAACVLRAHTVAFLEAKRAAPDASGALAIASVCASTATLCTTNT